MPSPVRVGTTRLGRPSGAGASRGQAVPGTTSGYGSSRADSVGFNPSNPQAYSASQAAKAYKTSKGTRDWDGDAGISPPLRAPQKGD